jgi:hypothetical protein
VLWTDELFSHPQKERQIQMVTALNRARLRLECSLPVLTERIYYRTSSLFYQASLLLCPECEIWNGGNMAKNSRSPGAPTPAEPIVDESQPFLCSEEAGRFSRRLSSLPTRPLAYFPSVFAANRFCNRWRVTALPRSKNSRIFIDSSSSPKPMQIPFTRVVLSLSESK